MTTRVRKPRRLLFERKESGRLTADRVDRARQTIQGVKVLGLDSRNGRRYDPDALRAALPLYEGVSVRANHPKSASDARDVHDVLGRLVNVRLEEDGIYADLEYLESHPLTARLLEAAERMGGKLFSLSHNADGTGDTVNGVFVVREILEVRSVDLVTDPATTQGLFEEVRRTMKLREYLEKLPLTSLHKKLIKRLMEQDEVAGEVDLSQDDLPPSEEDMGAGDADAAMREAFKQAMHSVVDDEGMDMASKLKRIKELLSTQEKLLGMQVEEQEEEESPAEDEEKEEEEEVTEGCNGKKMTYEQLKRENRRLKTELEVLNLCESMQVKPGPVLKKALLALDADADRRALLEESRKPSSQTGKPRTQLVEQNGARTNGVPRLNSTKDVVEFLKSGGS